MTNLLNGQRYFTVTETGAIYVPLPRELWGSSPWTEAGPCTCGRCDGSGLWDTLVIPGKNDRSGTTFTVHMPELQNGNRPEWLK